MSSKLFIKLLSVLAISALCLSSVVLLSEGVEYNGHISFRQYLCKEDTENTVSETTTKSILFGDPIQEPFETSEDNSSFIRLQAEKDVLEYNDPLLNSYPVDVFFSFSPVLHNPDKPITLTMEGIESTHQIIYYDGVSSPFTIDFKKLQTINGDTYHITLSAWDDNGKYICSNALIICVLATPLTSEETSENSLDESGDTSTPPTESTLPADDTSTEYSEAQEISDTSSDESEASQISLLFGDANNDGNTDMKDVLAMRKYIAGIFDSLENPENANVNHDDYIDMKDVLFLRKFLAKLLSWPN